MRTSRRTVISRSALLLLMVAGCGGSSDTPASTATRMQEPDGDPLGDADPVSMEAQILWSAEVKSTLQPLIESQLGLRNRIETSRPDEPIRIVLLELPPRTVPKELPSGEVRNVLNPNGAPSRIRLLVRDVIADSRLDIAGFELFNGKLNPESPTPFQ